MKPNKLLSLGVKLDQEDWNPVFNAQDIDEKVNKFTTSNLVTQLLDDILPETTIRTYSCFGQAMDDVLYKKKDQSKTESLQ